MAEMMMDPPPTPGPQASEMASVLALLTALANPKEMKAIMKQIADAQASHDQYVADTRAAIKQEMADRQAEHDAKAERTMMNLKERDASVKAAEARHREAEDALRMRQNAFAEHEKDMTAAKAAHAAMVDAHGRVAAAVEAKAAQNIADRSDLDTLTSTIDARMRNLEHRERHVGAREVAVAVTEQKANALRDQYEARMTALKTAVGG